MDTIRLTYLGLSRDFSVLGVRGIARFDETRRWPPTQQDLPDGSIRQRFSGTARKITIYFGVIASKSDRLFLFRWFASNAMQITYAGELIDVVPTTYNELTYERKWDFVMTKGLTLPLEEKRINAAAPTAWAAAVIPPNTDQ